MTPTSTITIRQIWVRYIISIFAIGIIFAGYLYLVRDERSRFQIGGGVIAISTLISGFVFDNKLPPQDDDNWILITLSVVMFSLGALLVWQIGKELNFTQDLFVKIVANPLVWFNGWGLLAISRLRMCIKATRQQAEIKGTEPQDG